MQAKNRSLSVHTGYLLTDLEAPTCEKCNYNPQAAQHLLKEYPQK